MLEHWIKNNLFKREGKALTNFVHTLPAVQSDLAHQSLKDPYLFDFLTLNKEHLEQELEQGLIDHIQKFLLELGQGFAFIGRQVHLEVAEKDFYIDLLFYHTKLHCYVVVELKTTEFDPRDAGQISFYLSAVDAQLKQMEDKPTIGLLLCQSKTKLIVEYALRTNTSPIGVASYEAKFVGSLPKNLQKNLPTPAAIEFELSKQTRKPMRKVASKKRA
jgi:predicted nuclease of restriction endonuclease-like (RecB) superfamily